MLLRGRAHAEWKVVMGGERQTVKDDQIFIDNRALIWGKGNPFCLHLINLFLVKS